jgi:hypothetical protein
VIRRLRRICRHYGSDPIFICSSATIANPRELAERLVEQPFELVDAARGLVGGGDGGGAAAVSLHQRGMVAAVDERDGAAAHGLGDGVVGLTGVDDLGQGTERRQEFWRKRCGHSHRILWASG